MPGTGGTVAEAPAAGEEAAPAAEDEPPPLTRGAGLHRLLCGLQAAALKLCELLVVGLPGLLARLRGLVIALALPRIRW